MYKYNRFKYITTVQFPWSSIWNCLSRLFYKILDIIEGFHFFSYKKKMSNQYAQSQIHTNANLDKH